MFNSDLPCFFASQRQRPSDSFFASSHGGEAEVEAGTKREFGHADLLIRWLMGGVERGWVQPLAEANDHRDMFFVGSSRLGLLSCLGPMGSSQWF